MSVTEEHLAGACGLDGEELTLALLHENERLLMSNAQYKRQKNAGFWCWLITSCLLIGLLIISLVSR
jgi:hypothetical protein